MTPRGCSNNNSLQEAEINISVSVNRLKTPADRCFRLRAHNWGMSGRVLEYGGRGVTRFKQAGWLVTNIVVKTETTSTKSTVPPA